MKPEVPDFGPSACRIERPFDILVGFASYRVVEDIRHVKSPCDAYQRLSHRVVDGYLSSLPILGLLKQDEPMSQVNGVPFEVEDFSLPHTSVQSTDDNGPEMLVTRIDERLALFL